MNKVAIFNRPLSVCGAHSRFTCFILERSRTQICRKGVLALVLAFGVYRMIANALQFASRRACCRTRQDELRMQHEGNKNKVKRVVVF
jgi:hypothetical protein